MEVHWSYIAYAVGVIYVWQTVVDFFHDRRENPSWALRCAKPSYVLEKIAQGAKALFRFLGHAAGVISSFYDYIRRIDLAILYMPLWRMAKPIYKLLTSWFYFFDGYARFARTFTTRRDTVYVGSTLLIVAAWMGVLYSLNRNISWGAMLINAIPATCITWGACYTAYVVAMALHVIGKYLWSSKKTAGLFEMIRKIAEETMMGDAAERLKDAALQPHEKTFLPESSAEPRIS